MPELPYAFLLSVAFWWTELPTGLKWSYSAAFLVLIGVVGESIADLTKCIKDEKLRKKIEKASALILILGLTGDLVSIRMGQIELTELTRVAGDARASAADAQQKVGEVAKQADTLKARLESASRQLDQLEKDIIAQGPRWRLLEKATPKLVKQLAPFAGQKIELFVCGTEDSTKSDREAMSTWARIADILESDGARWSVLHGGLSFWDTKPLSCEGIMEWVSSDASKNTMEAAKALGSALSNTLPPSGNKMPDVVNGEFALSSIRRGFVSERAPWVKIAKDPDLITVLIGAHPQTDVTLTKSKKTK